MTTYTAADMERAIRMNTALAVLPDRVKEAVMNRTEGMAEMYQYLKNEKKEKDL